MNRGQSSDIRFKKRPTFKPIMLTSKSMKPVERSSPDKNKHQQKQFILPQKYQKRRKSHNNCMIYANSITKAETIRKMTQQYRQRLMRSMYVQQDEFGNQNPVKPYTASIVQMQFYQDEPIKKNNHRYENVLTGLNLGDIQKLTTKKYFYYTHFKAQESQKEKSKVPQSKSTNLGLSSPSQAQLQQKKQRIKQWESFLKKNSISIKKAKSLSTRDKIVLSKQKMQQISFRVQQYQNTLLKKLEDNIKSPQIGQTSTKKKKCVSPSTKCQRSKLFSQKKNDLAKIEEDIITKRIGTKKQYFVFGMGQSANKNNDVNSKYKFDIYKDFLWKIAFSNGLYVRVKDEIQNPYKIYVGGGNNRMLIKGIMRRRFWWTFVDKYSQDVNFVWTQLKINDFFTHQKSFKDISHKKKIIFRNRKAHSSMQTTMKNISFANFSKQQRNDDFECKSQKQEQKKSIQNEEANQSEIEHQVQYNMLDNIQVCPKDLNSRIFIGKDFKLWQKHLKNNKKFQQKMENFMQRRIKTMIRKKKIAFIDESKRIKIQNHFQCNYFLGNKKALFYSMRKYYELLGKDPFNYIPLTFHIAKGLDDPEFQRFLTKFDEYKSLKKSQQSQNIWIVKPGQHTNRGRGITVCSILDDVKIRLKSKEKSLTGKPHTYIIQKYIQRPLLYNRRKFDIRHYMLMTCVNGVFKGYWYDEGYLRTTSFEYNIRNCKSLHTHLTNDAIQKNSPDYGKYQKGNKVSYSQFNKYLKNLYKSKAGDKYDFYNSILPKMKEIATDSIRATYMLLSPHRYEHNFELFGLDFMIDEDMNVSLIEVNTNPCLEICCPILSRLLSNLIENVFKICVDPYYPPPYEWPAQKKMQMGENAFEENKFSLVFDENTDGQFLSKLFQKVQKIDEKMGQIDQEDEEFQDQGKQWEQD